MERNDYPPRCWLCNDLEPDTKIVVECDVPNGKHCKAKTVEVHFGCYMDIEP